MLATGRNEQPRSDLTVAAVAEATHPAQISGVTLPVDWQPVRIAPSKRALDITVAGLLLLVTSPICVAIALLVKRDGGPVFFRQRRIGSGGQMFEIKKFRSMAVDAEERLQADPELHASYLANGFKLPASEDPRITRWGNFLRSTSLDELPQLVSVIRGDMSMVGPRPIIEPELVEYTRRGARDAYLSARPGLTGLWQVSGRSALKYDRRVALDLDYLERASLLLDLKIIAKTAGVVLRRIGAH